MHDAGAIVFYSTVHWDALPDRPQEVALRLGRTRRVLYVEEPGFEEDRPPFWAVSAPVGGVTVARVYLPVPGPGFGDRQTRLFVPMIEALFEKEQVDEHAAWLCTPMAFPVARAMRPQRIVYDCMFDVRRLPEPPAGIAARERDVLSAADLVLVADASLAEDKRRLRPSLECLPGAAVGGDGTAASWDALVARMEELLAGLPSKNAEAKAAAAAAPRPQLRGRRNRQLTSRSGVGL